MPLLLLVSCGRRRDSEVLDTESNDRRASSALRDPDFEGVVARARDVAHTFRVHPVASGKTFSVEIGASDAVRGTMNVRITEHRDPDVDTSANARLQWQYVDGHWEVVEVDSEWARLAADGGFSTEVLFEQQVLDDWLDSMHVKHPRSPARHQ